MNPSTHPIPARLSYFAQLRFVLTLCRVRGMQYDRAWELALDRCGRGDDVHPGTLRFARDAFREGYYRRTVLGGASILAEYAQDYDDETPAVGASSGYSTTLAGRLVA